jgi:hypothetical protein
MPIVSFMPYYPDKEVDRATAKFHVWNWWCHREKRVPDPSVRAYLDKYFALYRRADGGVEQRIAIISPGDVGTFPEEAEFAGRQISRFAKVVMASHLFELPVENNDGRAICTSDNFVALCQEFKPGLQGRGNGFSLQRRNP